MSSYSAGLCDVENGAFQTGTTNYVLLNEMIDTLNTLTQGSISFWVKPDAGMEGVQRFLFGISNTDDELTGLKSLYATYNVEGYLSIHLWKNKFSNNMAWVIKNENILLEPNNW